MVILVGYALDDLIKKDLVVAGSHGFDIWSPTEGTIQHDAATPKRDRLTIHDYLWRWDADWFWCSRAFGVQRPMVRRLWPRRYRRSDVYRKLVAIYRR